MNIQSDVKILDQLCVVNLQVTLWSARRKMSSEDLGVTELPPAELATLGSKRICDPEKLKVFNTIKARAVSMLERNGVRFLSGWAIPEDKLEDVLEELAKFRDEFGIEKDKFLDDYINSVQDWLNKNNEWANIIKDSTASSDYVRNRISFNWQIFKVKPSGKNNAQKEKCGLVSEVMNLGNTLFNEISQSAKDMWKNVYEGKTEVTHKALSPLRTLKDKLIGLSFVEPHVAPVVDIINTAITAMPEKGNIIGRDLLLLQGLVCLLKDTETLVTQSQAVIDGYSPALVLDSILPTATDNAQPEIATGKEAVSEVPFPMQKSSQIVSMGLW